MHVLTGRSLGCLLVCLTLAVPAAALAKAAFKPGNYAGDGPAVGLESISFKAAKKRVTRLEFEVDKPAACSNGGTLGDSQDGYVYPNIKIKDGKFSVTGNYQGDTATAQFRLSGRLKGKKASGTLRSVVDRTDGLHCDSGTLKWKATRR